MMNSRTRPLRILFAVLFIFMLFAEQGRAQCTVSQTGNSLVTEGSVLAQSFIPGCEGALSTIKLKTDAIGASGVVLKLYEDNAGVLTEIWSVSGINFPAGQEVTVDMATGSGTTRNLQSTSTYVFSLESAAPFTLKFEPSVPTDPYPDGCIVEIMSNTATCIVGAGAGDLFFEITLGLVLPVELTHFTISPVQDQVVLNWATASETSNLGFEIERSQDGLNWATLGFIPGKGNTTQTSVYNYIDPAPVNGNNYYRLKQLDLQGSFEYSFVRSINLVGNEISLQVFPNPAASNLYFSLDNHFLSETKPLRLTLVHLASGTIIEKAPIHPASPVNLNGLASGQYLLVISDGNNTWKAAFVKGN